ENKYIKPTNSSIRNSDCFPRRVPFEDNQISNTMASTAYSDSVRTADPVAPTADSKHAYQDQQIEELKAPTAASHDSSKRKQMKEEEMKEDETKEDETKEDETKEEDTEEEEETGYYPLTGCKCCAKLATMEFVSMPDDEDYTGDTDRIREPGLRLRMIHYSREFAKSGGFDVVCPPRGCFGGVYNIDHFTYPDKLTDRKLAEHAIEEYNDKNKKGKKLNLGKVVNITASCGTNMVYYLTFEGLDSENDTIDTYQAIVSYHMLNHKINRVYVFRRKSDGEDLLEPHSNFAERSRPRHMRKQRAESQSR
ncbi:hypothetical protein LINPERHAP1_LOCUS31951, partial [Linum perenne]